jgi:hypothetical protein
MSAPLHLLLAVRAACLLHMVPSLHVEAEERRGRPAVTVAEDRRKGDVQRVKDSAAPQGFAEILCVD